MPGFAPVPEALLDDRRLSDRAVRAYALLSRYGNASGQRYPSRETLAERLDCSPSTLDRTLAELVNAGWIAVARRGRTKSNLYTLYDRPRTKVTRLVRSSVHNLGKTCGGDESESSSVTTRESSSVTTDRKQLTEIHLPLESSYQGEWCGACEQLTRSFVDAWGKARLCTCAHPAPPATGAVG